MSRFDFAGSTLFDALREIHRRPAPFETSSTRALWTDAYRSERMLAFHLDEVADVASRNSGFIDRSVDWIAGHFGAVPAKTIVDFGCGPGLYTNRLARSGAAVTGIDFSERSIAHARKTANENGLSVRYLCQDYLQFETEERFDLVLMIMCDYCALGPEQRGRLLDIFRTHLKPTGSVLFDVYSLESLRRREERATSAWNLLDGFWADGGYFGFLNTFVYDDARVVLDKYTIVRPGAVEVVHNWLQCYSLEDLENELRAHGLEIKEAYADVSGKPFDPVSEEFCVVATQRPQG